MENTGINKIPIRVIKRFFAKLYIPTSCKLKFFATKPVSNELNIHPKIPSSKIIKPKIIDPLLSWNGKVNDGKKPENEVYNIKDKNDEITAENTRAQ